MELERANSGASGILMYMDRLDLEELNEITISSQRTNSE
jgi:hypothetical protein